MGPFCDYKPIKQAFRRCTGLQAAGTIQSLPKARPAAQGKRKKASVLKLVQQDFEQP